jgi:hypothetical protein
MSDGSERLNHTESDEAGDTVGTIFDHEAPKNDAKPDAAISSSSAGYFHKDAGIEQDSEQDHRQSPSDDLSDILQTLTREREFFSARRRAPPAQRGQSRTVPATAAAAAALGWSAEPEWHAEILGLVYDSFHQPPRLPSLDAANLDDLQRQGAALREEYRGVSVNDADSHLPLPGWSSAARRGSNARREDRAARVRALRAAALDLSARVEMLAAAATVNTDGTHGYGFNVSSVVPEEETFIAGGLPFIGGTLSTSTATSAAQLVAAHDGPDTAIPITGMSAINRNRRIAGSSSSRSSSCSSRRGGGVAATELSIQNQRHSTAGSSDDGISDGETATNQQTSGRRGANAVGRPSTGKKSLSLSSSSSGSPSLSRQRIHVDSAAAAISTTRTNNDNDRRGDKAASRTANSEVQCEDDSGSGDGSDAESSIEDRAITAAVSGALRQGTIAIRAHPMDAQDDTNLSRDGWQAPGIGSQITSSGPAAERPMRSNNFFGRVSDTAGRLGGNRWPVAPFGPSDAVSESDDDQEWAMTMGTRKADDPFCLGRMLRDLKDREQQTEDATAAALVAAAEVVAEEGRSATTGRGLTDETRALDSSARKSDFNEEVSEIAARRRAIGGVLSPREVAALISRAEGILGTCSIAGGSGLIGVNPEVATTPFAVSDSPAEIPNRDHFADGGHVASIQSMDFAYRINDAPGTFAELLSTNTQSTDSAGVIETSTEGRESGNREMQIVSAPTNLFVAGTEGGAETEQPDTLSQTSGTDPAVPLSNSGEVATSAGRAVPPPASHSGVWPDGENHGYPSTASSIVGNRRRLAPAELQARLMAEVHILARIMYPF